MKSESYTSRVFPPPLPPPLPSPNSAEEVEEEEWLCPFRLLWLLWLLCAALCSLGGEPDIDGGGGGGKQ